MSKTAPDNAAGSAALLYPAVMVFLLLFGAIVLDSLLLVTHQRALVHHTEAVGRAALTGFDRDSYRTHGTIVPSDLDGGGVVATNSVLTDVSCTITADINQVDVTCRALGPRGLAPRPSRQQVTVHRRVVADLVCDTCATFTANDD